MAEPALSPPQRTGRRVAQVIYWGGAGLISIACATAITLQVFDAPPGPRFSSCAAGLASLSSAVDRARAAAAGSEGTEDQAISRFRAALEPDWSGVAGVAASCRGKAEDERALDALERLRYAEEHAVRRESGELAPLRREVRRKVPSQADTSPSSAPSP